MPKDFFCKLKFIFIPCQNNKYRPVFLGSKFLFYYAVVLLLLKLAVIPFLVYLPETAFFADLTKIELINFVNVSREQLGLQSLRENTELNEAAYLKAKDMFEKEYFAHYSLEGVSPWFWLKLIGYNYQAAGENLAIGFLESEQVHRAWMNSESHKKNILNPNYQEIGIAVLKGNFKGSETTLVVQYFGNPREVILAETAPLAEIPAEIEMEIPETEPETRQPETEPETQEPEAEPEIELETPIVAEAETETEAEEEGIVEGEFLTERDKFVLKGTLDEKTPAFLLFQFMTSDYYDIIQKIIYGSLILVILVLFVTVYCDIFVYRKFKIDYKDVVFKTIGFSALWFVLIFLDKMIMIELVNPQNFIIY